MEYGVLGPLEVVAEGRPVEVRSRNERVVLSALVLGAGEAVGADRLIDALWGEHPPRSAAKTLQNYVLRLRKLLGADAIETHGPSYRLAGPADQSDAVRFAQLAESGAAAGQLGAPDRASSVLREALALWRGRAFEELAGWPEVAADVARLEEWRSVAAEQLMDADLAAGRHLTAVIELERLVVQEPFRERRWSQLMVAQYRCGRQSDALRTYQRARTLLLDELGIEPGPELRATEQAVIDQATWLDAPAGGRVASGRAGVVVALVMQLPTTQRGEGAGCDGPLDPYRALLQSVAASHRGSDPSVDATEGVAWFSSPLDCLDAALELQQRTAGDDEAAEGGALPAGGGRIGIHAGEPDATAREATRSIDLVARSLSRIAEPGQILLSEVVRELVEGRSELVFDEVGGIEVEGSPGPVAALELVGELAAATGVARQAPSAPFKGLAAFEPEDRDLFFGREHAVAQLVQRVGEDRFLAVVGSSGSGKSSIVRAGIIGSISAGRGPRTRWGPTLLMTPGSHPVAELVSAVTRLGASVSAGDVVRDPGTLDRAARSLTAADHERVVLVVDQFEELFTQCRDDAERRAFVRAITAAVRARGGPVVVVLALRADFLGACGFDPELSRLLEANMALLAAMRPDDLYDAIEGPARRAGLRLEPGLADLIVRDVADEPGGLPLLSHALLETWVRRRRRTLTVEGYKASGGVRGAIAETAESVYADLDSAQQDIARNLLLRLTEVGEGMEETRRRAALRELTSGAQPDAIERVLRRLAEARLVTVGEDSVEMAHEAIIREWPRLLGWIDEDREGLRLRRHLGQAARDWEALDRDPSELYRGPRLAAVTDWLTLETNVQLNAPEQEFVRASTDAATAEAAEGRAREAARERANRRLRVLLAATAIALVVALVAGLSAFAQRDRANRAASTSRADAVRAEVGRLVAESETLQSENRYLGALLALQANRLDDDAQTRGAVLSSLLEDPRHVLTLPVDGSSGARVLPGAEAALVVTAGRLEKWDLRRGTRTSVLPIQGVSSMALRGDGHVVAVATSDRIRIVDLSGHQVAPTIVTGKSTPAQNLAFSPDGSVLAAAFGIFGDPHAYDGAKWAQLYRVASGRATGPALSGHTASISAIAFSPDGRRLATGGNDAKVLVHDLSTGVIEGAPMAMSTPVWSVTFDPAGQRVFVGDLAPELGVFDAGSGRQIRLVTTVVQATPTFRADGRVLALGGNGPVQLLGAGDLQPSGESIDAQSGTAIPTFSPDGRLLIAGSSGPATVWDLAGRSVLDRPVPGAETYVFPLPGGRLVAAPGFADSVALYDVRTLRPRGALSPGRGKDLGNTLVPTAFAASYYVGTHIAVLNRSGTLQLFDTATQRKIGGPFDLGYAAAYAVFSRDLGRIAVGGQGGQVTLVDLRTRTVTKLLSPLNNYVLGLAFSPHGDLYAADTGVAVRFTHLATDRPRAELLAAISNPSFGGGMDLSPDGHVLAVAQGGQVGLYDARTMRRLGPMVDVSTNRIVWLAYSRDGRMLVSEDTADSARLIDTGEGRVVGPPMATAKGSGAVFSLDGKTLGTSTPAGGVLMSIDPAVWRREACELAGRNLTDAEWTRYLPSEGERQRTCPEFR